MALIDQNNVHYICFPIYSTQKTRQNIAQPN